MGLEESTPGLKSDRCKERVAQYKIDYDDGMQTEYVCLPCFQLIQTEQKLKPKGDGKVFVYTQTTTTATKLVQKWVEKVLGDYTILDCTLYVTMKDSALKAGDVCLKIRDPKKPKHRRHWNRWIEGRILVRGDLKYPHTKKVPTSTCQIKDPVSLALLGPKDAKWFYEYETFEFADKAEAYAWGAGYVIYKLLRLLKVIPGLATKVGCQREAGVYLKEFRKWRAKQKKTGTKPEMQGFVKASWC